MGFHGKTLGTSLDEATAAHPTKPFIVYEGEAITYEEAQRAIDDIARGLLSIGLKKGDHIALWMGNSPIWVFIQQAAVRIGCILVTINTHSVKREVCYSIKQSDANCLIFEPKFLKHDFMSILSEMFPDSSYANLKEALVTEFPALNHVIANGEDLPEGILSLQELIDLGSSCESNVYSEARCGVSGGDIAYMAFTSGTTGAPRGVLLQHESVVARGDELACRLTMTPDDIVFYGQPLFHIFGCVGAISSVISAGATLCIQKRFDADKALFAIRNLSCTVIFGVPTVFHALLDRVGACDFDSSSGRVALVSGSSASASLIRRIKGQLATSVISAYGCTECGGMATSTFPNDSLEVTQRSVGVPVPSVSLLIVDIESGKEVRRGTRGEVRIKSEFNMVGYYRHAADTKNAFDERGYMSTGDMGYLTDEGRLVLKGRKKDMVIVGGANVYPAEVEDVISQYPLVSQVQIVGIPDERLGEVVGCAIIKKPSQEAFDEEAFRAYCEANLSNYKIPRYLSIEQSFPVTGTGKPKKPEIRKRMIEEFKVNED